MTTHATHTTVQLDKLKVAAQVAIERNLVEGAHQPTFELIEDHVANRLVARLNAYMLTEHAGGAVWDEVHVALPVRPWWLPRWLWDRIPSRDETLTLSCRPRWNYPRASVLVPDLGPAVMYAEVQRPSLRAVPDWRDDEHDD